MNSYQRGNTIDELVKQNKILWNALDSQTFVIDSLQQLNQNLHEKCQNLEDNENALLVILSVLKKYENTPLSIEDINNLLNEITEITLNQLLGNSVAERYPEDVGNGLAILEYIQEGLQNNSKNVAMFSIEIDEDNIH